MSPTHSLRQRLLFQRRACSFAIGLIATTTLGLEHLNGQTIVLQSVPGPTQPSLSIATPQVKTGVPNVSSQAVVIQGSPGMQSRVVVQAQGVPLAGAPQVSTGTSHLGPGPIRLQELSDEILNCPVCRQRLGLSPLPSVVRSSSNVTVTASDAVAPNTPKHNSIPSTNSISEDVRSMAASPGVQGSVRMLGSPGLMSPGMAAQMASDGLVVEEFVAPKPDPGAIQLDGIPLEARQQFLRSLDLPFGARVMSANVAEPKSQQGTGGETENVLPVPKLQQSDVTELATSKDGGLQPSRSLGSPGIVTPENEKQVESQSKSDLVTEQASPNSSPQPPMQKSSHPDTSSTISQPNTSKDVESNQLTNPGKENTESHSSNPEVKAQQKRIEELLSQNELLTKQLQEVNSQNQKRIAETERAMNERSLTLSKERENLAAKISELDEQRRRSEDQLQKRIAQADSANREVLTLLEKRTAEVTELQEKLNEQLSSVNKTSNAKRGSAPKKRPSDKRNKNSQSPAKKD